MPLDAKVVATRGLKVNKEGDIRGKGHAKRDIVEPDTPFALALEDHMLPAREPKPTLKGESQLTLRLMDDVQIPQVQASTGPDWRFFGRPKQRERFLPEFLPAWGSRLLRRRQRKTFRYDSSVWPSAA